MHPPLPALTPSQPFRKLSASPKHSEETTVLFFSNVHLFILRERERAEEGQRERIPSRLCTVSTEPDTGLELAYREIVTRAEIKSQTLNPQSHPGA